MAPSRFLLEPFGPVFFFTNLFPLTRQTITLALLALDSLILWAFTLISNKGSSIFSFEHLLFFGFKHGFGLHWLHCSVAVDLLHLSWLRTSNDSHSFLDLLWPSPWFSFFMSPSWRQFFLFFASDSFLVGFFTLPPYKTTSHAAFFSRSQLHEELHYVWLHLILFLHLDRGSLSPHQSPSTILCCHLSMVKLSSCCVTSS